jgi:hypothetical protein
MRPVSLITDRAKRYRANAGRKKARLCAFCANPAMDVDHISGDEAHGKHANLIDLCRSCNTRKGIVQKRARIGKRTRQYNPEAPARQPTFEEYIAAVRILRGDVDATYLEVRIAGAIIQATNDSRRAAYTRMIQAQRQNPYPSPFKKSRRPKWVREALPMSDKERKKIEDATEKLKQASRTKKNTDSIPTFAQYAYAVSQQEHSGAHGEAGAIIHATPAAKRHEYAMEIARRKRRRGTSGSQVPF